LAVHTIVGSEEQRSFLPIAQLPSDHDEFQISEISIINRQSKRNLNGCEEPVPAAGESHELIPIQRRERTPKL